MIWGCITCEGVGPLTKLNGRMKAPALLDNTLVPFITSLGPGYIFQDDNVPYHRAKSVSFSFIPLRA